MPSIVIEHFDRPTSARDARTLGDAGERAAELLAGRTVWCAAAQAGEHGPAQELRDHVHGAGPGVAATPLRVTADDPLLRLAERLDAMLAGADPAGGGPWELRRAEADMYAEGARDGDVLMGEGVGADDVVVVHDALSAIVASAARERGAHAVWHVSVTERPGAGPREALDFLQRFLNGIDAYIMEWPESAPRQPLLEHVAAAMPSPGVVATKDYLRRSAGDEPERLAWRTVLAEVVRSDRSECVGGTLHPRPAVPMR